MKLRTKSRLAQLAATTWRLFGNTLLAGAVAVVLGICGLAASASPPGQSGTALSPASFVFYLAILVGIGAAFGAFVAGYRALRSEGSTTSNNTKE